MSLVIEALKWLSWEHRPVTARELGEALGLTKRHAETLAKKVRESGLVYSTRAERTGRGAAPIRFGLTMEARALIRGEWLWADPSKGLGVTPQKPPRWSKK